MSLLTAPAETDVAVVGGGLTGLLTALGLRAAGLDVVLVESRTVGARQSSASHGYLHRGFAYGPAEEGMTPALAEARPYWDQLRSPVEITSESYAASCQDEGAACATADWSGRGLSFDETVPPRFLRGVARAFRTHEPTIDVGRLLSGLLDELRAAGVPVLDQREAALGTAARGRVEVVLRSTSSGEVGCTSARHVVLATGAGLVHGSDLTGTSTLDTRRAYMAAFTGDLPMTSLIFPESARHGLFIAPRPTTTRGRVVWLVSDYQSFAPSVRPEDGLSSWWTEHIRRSLGSVLTSELMSGIELLGVYSEIKSGLKPPRGTVSALTSIASTTGPVVIAAPSKLTLAPVAAERATALTLRALRTRTDEAPVLLDHLTRTPRSTPGTREVRERWESLRRVHDVVA